MSAVQLTSDDLRLIEQALHGHADSFWTASGRVARLLTRLGLPVPSDILENAERCRVFAYSRGQVNSPELSSGEVEALREELAARRERTKAWAAGEIKGDAP